MPPEEIELRARKMLAMLGWDLDYFEADVASAPKEVLRAALEILNRPAGPPDPSWPGEESRIRFGIVMIEERLAAPTVERVMAPEEQER